MFSLNSVYLSVSGWIILLCKWLTLWTLLIMLSGPCYIQYGKIRQKMMLKAVTRKILKEKSKFAIAESFFSSFCMTTSSIIL